MEQIRSFIAIELPDKLKLELTRLETRLESREPSLAKWVDPNGIHLTLKFLGNIAAERIGEITGVMAEAAGGIPPFHLEVKDLGVFPNLKRVQVVWVGLVGGIDKLAQLQQRIESGLAPLGFVSESRPFTPHLTLARIRDRASLDERQRFGQLIATTRFEATCTIEVGAISLMRSQLTRQGAIYSQIGSVKLSPEIG